MRSTGPIQLALNLSVSTTQSSKGIYLAQITGFSIQAIWTGASLNGNVRIQISNDNVKIPQYSSMATSSDPQPTDPAVNVTNWSDYSGTEQIVSGSGSFLWNISDAEFGWVKVLFTNSSGTGIMTANAWIKGK